MIPIGIKEEDFKYRILSDEAILEAYNEFKELLIDFSHTVNYGKLKIIRPVICRICVRVDQRKDYYMYYHSNDDKIMKMSHEKELALWAYWVCKYKPIRFKDEKDDALFFVENDCMVSDAFAAYIIISTVCAGNKKRAKYFSKGIVENLYYDMANRDFSKEAIIARINDLIAKV